MTSFRKVNCYFLALPLMLSISLVSYAGSGNDLRKAAKAGNLNEVVRLLEQGVDPNSRGKGGGTALHKAAKKGHLEIVQLLVFKGANPALPNSKGRSALDVAERNEQDHIMDIMRAAVEPNEVFLYTNKSMSEAEFAELMTAALLGRRWQIETKEKYRMTASYNRGRRVFRVETELKDDRIYIRFIRGYGSTRSNYLNNLRSDLSKRL